MATEATTPTEPINNKRKREHTPRCGYYQDGSERIVIEVEKTIDDINKTKERNRYFTECATKEFTSVHDDHETLDKIKEPTFRGDYRNMWRLQEKLANTSDDIELYNCFGNIIMEWDRIENRLDSYTEDMRENIRYDSGDCEWADGWAYYSQNTQAAHVYHYTHHATSLMCNALFKIVDRLLYEKEKCMSITPRPK